MYSTRKETSGRFPVYECVFCDKETMFITASRLMVLDINTKVEFTPFGGRLTTQADTDIKEISLNHVLNDVKKKYLLSRDRIKASREVLRSRNKKAIAEGKIVNTDDIANF